MKKSPLKNPGNPNGSTKQNVKPKGLKDDNPKRKKIMKSNPNADEAHGLRKLFVAQLKDIYWAEKAMVKALPKMVKKSTSEELVNALSQHLEATMRHVSRLEQVFASMEEKPVAKTCAAMVGLIAEAGEIMGEIQKGMVLDAGIILAAQKIEHYEIATYGTLCSFAKTLGEFDVAALLLDNLDDEKASDMSLTEIAESFVNEEAVV